MKNQLHPQNFLDLKIWPTKKKLTFNNPLTKSFMSSTEEKYSNVDDIFENSSEQWSNR